MAGDRRQPKHPATKAFRGVVVPWDKPPRYSRGSDVDARTVRCRQRMFRAALRYRCRVHQLEAELKRLRWLLRYTGLGR